MLVISSPLFSSRSQISGDKIGARLFCRKAPQYLEIQNVEDSNRCSRNRKTPKVEWLARIRAAYAERAFDFSLPNSQLAVARNCSCPAPIFQQKATSEIDPWVGGLFRMCPNEGASDRNIQFRGIELNDSRGESMESVTILVAFRDFVGGKNGA